MTQVELFAPATEELLGCFDGCETRAFVLTTIHISTMRMWANPFGEANSPRAELGEVDVGRSLSKFLQEHN